MQDIADFIKRFESFMETKSEIFYLAGQDIVSCSLRAAAVMESESICPCFAYAVSQPTVDVGSNFIELNKSFFCKSSRTCS